MAHSILVAKPSRCARNVVLLIVGFHATLFEGPLDRVSEVMVAAVNLKSFTRNRALDMQSNSGVNFVSDTTGQLHCGATSKVIHINSQFHYTCDCFITVVIFSIALFFIMLQEIIFTSSSSVVV